MMTAFFFGFMGIALWTVFIPTIVVYLILKWGGLAVTQGEQRERWEQIIKNEGFTMTVTIGLVLAIGSGIASLAAQAHPSLLCVSGTFMAGFMFMIIWAGQAHHEAVVIKGWMLSVLVVAAGITLLILGAAALAQFSAMDRFS